MYMAQMCERNFESVNCQRNQLNPTEIVIHLAFGYQRKKKKTKISEKKKTNKNKNSRTLEYGLPCLIRLYVNYHTKTEK